MVLNAGEMRSNGIKVAFFSKKLQKIKLPGGSVLRPGPPKPLVAGGSAPRPPSAIRLSYTSLLNMTPKLDFGTF